MNPLVSWYRRWTQPPLPPCRIVKYEGVPEDRADDVLVRVQMRTVGHNAEERVYTYDAVVPEED